MNTQGPLPKFIPVWCSTSVEDIELHRVHYPNCIQFPCLNFRVLPLLKTLNIQGPCTQMHSIPMSPIFVFLPLLKTLTTQGPSHKFIQFLCLQFGVLPLLKTLNAQGPSSKLLQFLCLNFRVLPLLKTLNTQGPLPKFYTGSITHLPSISMSQFSCSTSFEDIEYTGSITQIHSIPMSPVWCSTSFEYIDYTGSIITNCIQFLCLQFGVLPLLKTLTTQGPSSQWLQFLCLNFRVLPLLKTLNTQGP